MLFSSPSISAAKWRGNSIPDGQQTCRRAPAALQCCKGRRYICDSPMVATLIAEALRSWALWLCRSFPRFCRIFSSGKILYIEGKSGGKYRFFSQQTAPKMHSNLFLARFYVGTRTSSPCPALPCPCPIQALPHPCLALPAHSGPARSCTFYRILPSVGKVPFFSLEIQDFSLA